MLITMILLILKKNDEILKKDLDKIDSVVDKHKENFLVHPFMSNTANAYELD